MSFLAIVVDVVQLEESTNRSLNHSLHSLDLQSAMKGTQLSDRAFVLVTEVHNEHDHLRNRLKHLKNWSCPFDFRFVNFESNTPFTVHLYWPNILALTIESTASFSVSRAVEAILFSALKIVAIRMHLCVATIQVFESDQDGSIFLLFVAFLLRWIVKGYTTPGGDSCFPPPFCYDIASNIFPTPKWYKAASIL